MQISIRNLIQREFDIRKNITPEFRFCNEHIKPSAFFFLRHRRCEIVIEVYNSLKKNAESIILPIFLSRKSG